MKIDEISADYRGFIEDYLKNWMTKFHDEPQKVLYDAMEYSLLGGGKRLRPILTLEFCRLCCGDWKRAAPFAAAIEMIQDAHEKGYAHDDGRGNGYDHHGCVRGYARAHGNGNGHDDGHGNDDRA